MVCWLCAGSNHWGLSSPSSRALPDRIRRFQFPRALCEPCPALVSSRYTSLRVQYFRPFFLPCFVSSSITLCSIVVALVFLEETLPSKIAAQHGKIPDAVQGSDYGAIVQPTRIIKAAPPPTAMELVANPKIRSVLTAGFFLWFLSISWDTVFVLFAYTPAALGGLQRTPAEIGIFLATLGGLGIFMALVAFPILQHRFGTLALYRACMSLWPIMFMLFSATSLFARQALGTLSNTGSHTALACMWIGVSLILLTDRVATMAYATNVMAVKAVAPSRSSLGATFGLSMSVGCCVWSIAPAFVSSLFALSINHQILGGQFVWLVMFCIALGGYIAVRRLR
ncbi:hypothetical protein FRB93_002912 [Tulasnella sp. JGI-2019a]|nr:hypothetical protein FRB93_002912 [Tulasnella sp. JGI-2019a]